MHSRRQREECARASASRVPDLPGVASRLVRPADPRAPAPGHQAIHVPSLPPGVPVHRRPAAASARALPGAVVLVRPVPPALSRHRPLRQALQEAHLRLEEGSPAAAHALLLAKESVAALRTDSYILRRPRDTDARHPPPVLTCPTVETVAPGRCSVSRVHINLNHRSLLSVNAPLSCYTSTRRTVYDVPMNCTAALASMGADV